MGKGSSFFAFLAGAAAGALFVVLASTDKGGKVADELKQKGGKIVADGKEAVLNGLDKLEQAISGEEENI